MKAFAVLEEGENTGGIIFADRAVVARRLGADRYADGEFGAVTCHRAPWADPWAKKKEDVPARVCIDNGWHFECAGCGETIDGDWLDEEDLPLEGVIGTQHSAVYCCEICQCREKLRGAIQRDHERRAIEALQAFVRKRFPSANFSTNDNWKPHAYASQSDGGVWLVRQVVVSFPFPGMKIGPATCLIDRGQRKERFIGPIRPEYQCCFGDKEVFEAWVASAESRG